ncbi:ROK family protein [Streptacidiphilus cavernicola]|uniref:ROK family protein n=1 Tax=Streptacidiphilus cavernicola TaxID=3342716 RepID=A0ABV6VNC9_9ACTN
MSQSVPAPVSASVPTPTPDPAATPDPTPVDQRLVVAVDIGGTKIAAGLVDSRGTLVASCERPTPTAADAATVLRTVGETVTDLRRHRAWAQVVGLGVCSAGPVDVKNGLVSPVNIPAWRDFPVIDRLTGHPALAGLPCAFVGDAVAMAAAEHRFGAARGHRDALCLVVSTGIGAGLILDGQVRYGITGNAGHLGHISVDYAGEPCPCGSHGCLERLSSGTAIARHATRLGWTPPPGTAATASSAAVDARLGHPAALQAFDLAAQALASGIAAVAALVEIEVAVLGGGVMQAADLLLPRLRHHLRGYLALPFTQRLRIRTAELGTSAGLIGAASLLM